MLMQGKRSHEGFPVPFLFDTTAGCPAHLSYIQQLLLQLPVPQAPPLGARRCRESVSTVTVIENLSILF